MKQPSSITKKKSILIMLTRDRNFETIHNENITFIEQDFYL